MAEHYELGPHRSQGLVDVLDRILDKGLVIAGDIRIRLADVELLTVQIRLLVCSVDKADQIGLNWWRSDPYLAGRAAGESDLALIGDKLDRLDARLAKLEKKKLEKKRLE